jgi:copper chaperone
MIGLTESMAPTIEHRNTPGWYDWNETTMPETLTDSVPGMHCEHCERAVKTEVAQVAGVRSVDVDLDTKRVTVRGDGIADEAVRAAIDEAGYEAA